MTVVCRTEVSHVRWHFQGEFLHHLSNNNVFQEFKTADKVFFIYDGWFDGSFLADKDCWEGWWSILAGSLVAVETDSSCAPLPPFGQRKAWDEDGKDAVHSFCCLCFSYAALCLPASNSQLAFLTDKHQLSQSEVSCCHDWWLIPACASCLFSWSL